MIKYKEIAILIFIAASVVGIVLGDVYLFRELTIQAPSACVSD